MQKRTTDPRSPLFAQEFLAFVCDAGKLDAALAARARNTQLETGARIDVVLTELGLLSSDDLLALAAVYLDLPIANENALTIDHGHIETIPVDFLRRTALVPIGTAGDRLTVAVADPFALEPVAALAFELSKPIDVVLTTPQQVARLLDQISGQDVTIAPETANSTVAADTDVRRLKESASEAPIIRLINRICSAAVRARASDIHFETYQAGIIVRFRIDGVLVEQERIAREYAAAALSRLKIMAGLNIAEQRLPQDGRIKTAVDGRDIEVRVATTPVLHGESAVLRLLGQSSVAIELAKLGLERSTLDFLMRVTRHPHGIVLVTGPTGSGKTTTLYAVLKRLHNGERKIVSIEDPVEVAIEGISQIPVRPAIGLGFAEALRTVLRHDPDIIMIGEMRDHDTARTAIQAAMTGHMVLSTLHTNSAADSVTRLLDLGLEPYLIAATLNGVVSQRLVRRLCQACAVHAGADADLDLLVRAVNDARTVDASRVRQAVGCSACHDTGFHGRTTITETFVIDDAARDLINGRADAAMLRAAHSSEASPTLAMNGLIKVLAGETTAQEVLKVLRGVG